MVIIKKKDDTIRLYVDYRKLNAETELDVYPMPMPRLDDILSTLPLWILPKGTGRSLDRHKTAFITTKGLYQFRMMLFGLCGAPAIFQRMMDEVIRGMNQFASVYHDDLIVFSTTWEDHLAHLRVVLGRLLEVGLTTKPLKCQLGMSECTYLGHIVGNRVVKPEVSKLQAIDWFPLPETKTQV